jgi:hypothetical protein
VRAGMPYILSGIPGNRCFHPASTIRLDSSLHNTSSDSASICYRLTLLSSSPHSVPRN